MNKTLYYLVGFVLTISACNSLQFVNAEDTQDVVHRYNGKCFSACEEPSFKKNAVREFAIYTGNENEEDVELETIEVEVTRSSSKWIKKKRDNCQSADPNDCLVWCAVEVPGKTETITYLKDTIQSKNYYIKKYLDPNQPYNSKGIRLEIVCEENRSMEFLKEVEMALQKIGYAPDERLNQHDKVLHLLYNYQEDNLRAQCGFDVPTLIELGLTPLDGLPK